ncbi:hypothetical protein M5D96_010403 [Drosophila gunungcola]|uniref:Uncharacterized protein n=1 Tax=Drosophila gunungcola TaxID=103775 RepID=A0A9Q0BL80_9MUSC|nr:hypothetical protein M5D96_010403 [Drosophila gunungcola]
MYVCVAVCLRSADNFMIFAAVPKRGSLGYAGITTTTEGSDQRRSSRSSTIFRHIVHWCRAVHAVQLQLAQGDFPLKTSVWSLD